MLVMVAVHWMLLLMFGASPKTTTLKSSSLSSTARGIERVRVIVESLCRGRPVVASWSGGTPDVITDGVNGILVHPEDTNTLADVLVRVLSDRELVARMAAAARGSAEPFIATPDEYAARIRALVDRVLA